MNPIHIDEEFARKAGVGRDVELGERIADLEGRVAHPIPRTMSVHVPFTVRCPSWLVDTDSKT